MQSGLIVVVVVTILISRPFCRWVCPYGVLLGISALFGKWRVVIEPENSCKTCHLCPPACPVDCIRVEKKVEKSSVMTIMKVLGVAILLVGGFFIGGEVATLPKWIFEKEVMTFTPELLAHLKLTGHIMGLIVGISWSIELITALSPTPKGYTPIKSRCVSCGRCYNHCPGEVKLVREKLKEGKS